MRFTKTVMGVAVTLGLALSLPVAFAGTDSDRLQAANFEPPAPVEMALVPAAIDALVPTLEAEGRIETRPGEQVVYRHAPAASPYQAYVARFIAGYNKKLSWPEANAMAQAIMHYSQHYGVDFRLVTGLIAVESSFRSNAVSSSGAIGLGQLKPDTAKWLGVSDPYNPVDNIAGTTRFLSWLLKKYNGSLDHALSAYYQGPGTVDRQGITPACYPYLQKINKALSGLM